MKCPSFVAVILLLSLIAFDQKQCEIAFGGDWPAWRYDSGRTAASPNEVPGQLSLQWGLEMAPRRQAWDDPLNLDLMTYDRVFEPIVIGKHLIVGFNDRDKVVAYDTETGQEAWTVFADAPVRMPPVGHAGRVYFTSDDGNLYCVDVSTGQLQWKFQGAPNPQKAIGNQRISSAWPARGGPVVRDDTVYFAASVWPLMGTFIYALDAETGNLRWVNDGTGADYIKQPHSAPSFAGVGPQGAMVATEKYLIIPGGRSVPAVFNRKDGTLKYFEINAGGKGTGGSFVAADDKYFFVHTRLKGTRAFELESGLKTAFLPNEPILAGNLLYTCETAESGSPVVRCYDEAQTLLWEIAADGSGDLVLAGKTLVAAGKQAVTLISLPENGNPAAVKRLIEVPAPAERVLVADDKLFVVTSAGHILAYGERGNSSNIIKESFVEFSLNTDKEFDKSEIASVCNDIDLQGYSLWFGDEKHELLEHVIGQKGFQELAVVCENAEVVSELRSRLDRAGLYGTITAHAGNAKSFKAPQYIAHTVFVASDVVEKADESTLSQIYQSVRPYGGKMVLFGHDDQTRIAELVEPMGLEQAKVEVRPYGVSVTRVGKLPGAADWTHQYGNVANTVKSDDSRVKLPLGVLWYGGSSNMDVLPRHGHGPPEQVVGGRLFIQGMDCLSARDVYTGRVLWKRQFENLGTFDVYYDHTYEDTPLDPKYNQVHIPGANGRGTNYVATEDRVYIIEDNVCHALDPSTGETLYQIRLPEDQNGETKEWGYIGVYKDMIFGGLGFANYRSRFDLEVESDSQLSGNKTGFGSKSLDRAASTGLVAFDRYTGRQLWQVDALHSFWHNGIVVGGDRVYCLDKNPLMIEESMRRRGLVNPDTYRIIALDYRTGEMQWQVNEGVFGTWLGYSEKHDLLLQAGAKASDRLAAEVAEGMRVYKASTGEIQWKDDSLQYAGPCILHNDLIITNANSYAESAGAFNLVDGKQKLIANPITGQLQPWKVTRTYGCNNIIASENLLTFRSGAAGFYDLLTEGGTGNLGGFKSGCTSNLVVANGVLNAPDYTRTCSCTYQNQTSIAFVHMPDVEMWSVNSLSAIVESGDRIQRVGINFGAPGDRRDENGQLWIEYPEVAGTNPPIALEINPEATFYRHHSSTVSAEDRPWILSSGIEGLTHLRIQLKLNDNVNLATGIPVENRDDDAEEGENGQVDLSSSDLELVDDDGQQTIGLRFNNINLARGTEIRSARLQFTCDEPSDEPTALSIVAEAIGNAAAFAEESHNLTSRTRTKAEVAWQPEAWNKADESKDAQATPDLRALVAEVVNRDDWKAGNSLVFMIGGTGKRVASAYSGGEGSAAKLIIDADEAPIEEDSAATGLAYDVRLHFAVPRPLAGETRVFDVLVQDQLVLENATLSGAVDSEVIIKTIESVSLKNVLDVKLVPKQGKPVLAGIELIRK